MVRCGGCRMRVVQSSEVQAAEQRGHNTDTTQPGVMEQRDANKSQLVTCTIAKKRAAKGRDRRGSGTGLTDLPGSARFRQSGNKSRCPTPEHPETPSAGPPALSRRSLCLSHIANITNN